MESLELETWIKMFSSEEIISDKVQEYLDFVMHAVKNRDPERYSEWHHVIPKCIDEGMRYRDQGVLINGRDHFLAHKLLIEGFSSRRIIHKLSYAYMRMAPLLINKGEKITPEEYEEARKRMADSQTGENNPSNNPETRRKMSESQKKLVRITNGVYESAIRKGDPIPEGWYEGNSRSHADNIGKMIRSRVWVTNGFANRRVSPDKIPEGWSLGMTNLGGMGKSKGKVWITNGQDSKMIYPCGELPDGWYFGRK